MCLKASRHVTVCEHEALPEIGIAHAGPVPLSPIQLTFICATSHIKIPCFFFRDILDLNSDGLAGGWLFMAGMPL